MILGILINAAFALGFIYLWMLYVYPLFVTWAKADTTLVRTYSVLYFIFVIAFITYAIGPLFDMLLFST